MSTSEPGFEELFAEADRRARERSARRRRRRESRRPRGPLAELRASAAGRALVWIAAGVMAFTLVGLVLLWPSTPPQRQTGALGGATTDATVSELRTVPCGGPTAQDCRQLVVDVDGSRQAITLGPVAATLPDLRRGDHVRVARVLPAPGQGALPEGSEAYSFVGLDRRGGLEVLAVGLLALALVVVRLRGLLAAVGVLASIALMVTFTIPAILAGHAALLVALVSSLAVMFITVLLTNGLSAQSLAAALGVSATLVLTCAVAELALAVVHLDGRSDEFAQYLAQQNAGLSLQGIVLAGMLIGALGVLADTAVTQASAVMALRRADPQADAAGLYRGAWSVGRDHLSATIHTLVLAYVGSALPLLLLMRSSSVSFTDTINTQDVAEPVAAALVGCIALIAAVPVTTALAALLVARVPVEDLHDPHSGHAH